MILGGRSNIYIVYQKYQKYAIFNNTCIFSLMVSTVECANEKFLRPWITWCFMVCMVAEAVIGFYHSKFACSSWPMPDDSLVVTHCSCHEYASVSTPSGGPSLFMYLSTHPIFPNRLPFSILSSILFASWGTRDSFDSLFVVCRLRRKRGTISGPSLY